MMERTRDTQYDEQINHILTHKTNGDRPLREALVRRPGVGISNKPKPIACPVAMAFRSPDSGYWHHDENKIET